MRLLVRVMFCFLMPVLASNVGSALAQTQPLRVAIVGLEHGHVAALLQELPNQHEVQLVGIVDEDEALSRRYEQQFHLDTSLFYTKLDAMIAAVHPQALLVYTSASKHRSVIEIAAVHGVNVMVEKPLTMSLADALAIRQTARQHHIHVMVNYVSTWYPDNHAVYDMATQGKLGDLRKIVFYGGHQGPKEIGVQPEFLKWLEDPEQNGDGALYDFGCYGADLVTWLMHGKAPISVTAIAQTDKPQTYPHVADDATIILRYSNAQAVLMPSWSWPFTRMEVELYGATGYAKTSGQNKLLSRVAGQQHESESTAPPLAPPNDGSLHYLVAVLNGTIKPGDDLSALSTNIVVMQILDAARQSVLEGRTIKLTLLPQ